MSLRGQFKVLKMAFDREAAEQGNIKVLGKTDTREDIIDSDTNELFAGCESVMDIEDVVESFWNRLNDRYTNTTIVKVIKVEPC